MAAVKQLGSILKTNVRACKALGHSYVVQLGRIYLDMLNVYKIMSENISQAISINGIAINNQPLIKAMHVVKKETLTLISEWVTRSNDSQMIMDNFIPPLLDAVLLDYQVCSFCFFFFGNFRSNSNFFLFHFFFLQRTKEPAAREPAVLSTMASIVNKLEGTITPEVLVIFNAVFECTLDMINKNFEDYPVHRTNFYEMLQAVNTHCFKAFLNLPPAQFKLVFDSIVWAFKHTMRNVADTGLQILYQVSEFH
jgi:exportin-1